MLYKLCNNGRAILLTREFKILEKNLTIRLSDHQNEHTAIIKTGEKIYYRTFKNGLAELDRSLIASGPIAISIVKNKEIKPTWICDELYADVKGGAVAVGGNTLEYDKLLGEQRIESDELRRMLSKHGEALLELKQHYEEIYEGYKLL